jgi:hypothetical protein
MIHDRMKNGQARNDKIKIILYCSLYLYALSQFEILYGTRIDTLYILVYNVCTMYNNE